jgi:hypothetical protein
MSRRAIDLVRHAGVSAAKDIYVDRSIKGDTSTLTGESANTTAIIMYAGMILMQRNQSLPDAGNLDLQENIDRPIA